MVSPAQSIGGAKVVREPGDGRDDLPGSRDDRIRQAASDAGDETDPSERPRSRQMVGALIMLASLPAIMTGLLILFVGIEWFEIGLAVMNDRG
jgi:hypothetical protein